MPNSLRPSALITAFFALGLAVSVRAQTSPATVAEPAGVSGAEPVKTEPATEPEAPRPAALNQPKHDRVMSSEVAATFASGMPKYNPPPKRPEPKPEEEQVDLRETDKPKNKIIRLQKYVVKEPKPPIFRERDLHTKSELTAMALKRHAGLKIGNIGGLNDPTALFMYEEKQRLGDISDLKDEARNAKNSGDSVASDYITKETNRTYYRPSDFGWNSDGGPATK
ncbi:MAG: hypothetical protein ABI222_16730 [Opitutaceae bacterium]